MLPNAAHIYQCGHYQQQQRNHHNGGNGHDALFLLLVLRLQCKFFVLVLGVALTHGLLHIVLINRVFQRHIALQMLCGQGGIGGL